jgi:dTDP-4-dehydrorhamnose reductase
VRIFVTGCYGLLGSSLVPALKRNHEVAGFGKRDADVGDREYLRGRLDAFRPDQVVHLGAMTAVDSCETEEDEAFRINAEGSRRVAEEAERIDVPILALSTDYVFDGEQRSPYRESDPPAPLSVYGRSKLAGEEAVRGAATRWTIVRSAWLFGPGGRNFVATILEALEALEAEETLPVVHDQVGSPTYTEDLTRALVTLIEKRVKGMYHLVNDGEASWCDLAQEAARLRGLEPGRVRPATTEEIGRPAPRPPYSVLDAGLVGNRFGLRLRSWRDALGAYLVKHARHARGEAS